MNFLAKSRVTLFAAVLLAGSGAVAYADTGNPPEVDPEVAEVTNSFPREASVLEDYSKDSKMTSSEAASFLDKLQLAVDGGALSPEEARAEASREGLSFIPELRRANPDFPYSRVLSNTPYVSQRQNGIYCGPASGTMIARQWGFNISIGTMANYMKTDTYGATDWNRRQFVSGINRALGYNNFYTQHNSPSAAGMNAAFQATVGRYGHPIAADAVEYRGGALYNNHPNPTYPARGHWIVGYGYSSNGTVGIWYDPAAAYFGGRVSTSFSSANSVMAQFMTANGIVY